MPRWSTQPWDGPYAEGPNPTGKGRAPVRAIGSAARIRESIRSVPRGQWRPSTDPDTIRRWWSAEPEANIILPTGRVFDVFDVPASAGVMAMAQMDRAGLTLGPVAVLDSERYLFFVATRSPIDEDEWWSCRLDCFPETVEDMPGLRWHCRDSYIPAPPSLLPSGRTVEWIRSPYGRHHPVHLPDPIAVLDILADVCGHHVVTRSYSRFPLQ